MVPLMPAGHQAGAALPQGSESVAVSKLQTPRRSGAPGSVELSCTRHAMPTVHCAGANASALAGGDTTLKDPDVARTLDR